MAVRRSLALTCFILGWLLTLGHAWAQPAPGAREVVVGDIRGIINPVMAGYVARVIDNAERADAAAVVFYMDTPGGLSDAMRDINQHILASKIPVVVYVAPGGARAGSAGVYIAYAAHLVGMAPTTNIGSATPVAMGDNGGEAQMSLEMKNKVTNDAVAQVRALAAERGRNADFAEQAVREGANLPAADALQQHVVNYVAADLPDLLRQMDGVRVKTAAGDVTLHTADAAQRDVAMTTLEQLLLTLTNPTIAYILLSLGSIGLMLELYNPGAVFPGVIGGICLLLAFYALGTLPLNYAALGLLAFGLLLLGLEPFVPSHGILSVGGAVAFAVGSLLLINVPEGDTFLEISRPVVAAVTFTLLGIFAVVIAAVVRGRRRPVVTGREGMVGEVGEARGEVLSTRAGFVHVAGELWQAYSTGGAIQPGTPVVVERIDGLRLYVRPAGSPASAGAVRPQAVAVSRAGQPS